jgi:glycine cleavage system H protein
VDLPAVGAALSASTVVGEIESTKSVGELFAPLDGEVVEANDAVVDDPSLVNSDPFGAGWLVSVRYDALPDTLLSWDDYAALVGE